MVIYDGTDSIAITFDDGPNPEITPKILDILKDEGVKATFFIIGRRAEEYPNVVRRIVAEGHDLGNHTYSHNGLVNLLRENGKLSVEEEIKKGAEAIKRIADLTENELQFLRPPGLIGIAKLKK